MTLDVIGGRWKAVILFSLLPGPRRFGEIRRYIPGVTQKMLTAQLRELEADGAILRRTYPSIPPKVEYSLTEIGRSLEGLLVAMRDWGAEHRNRFTETQRSESPDAACC